MILLECFIEKKSLLLTNFFIGEKAYKCQICNAAYVDRRSLRKHLEKIHPEANIEAFAKPLHSVPIIVEERIVTDSSMTYTEMQV